jgi:membrane fusion protein (multidrug efflux system)
MSPGTGSQFSLLPPENATGNWVKVVQRVPVRLQLTDLGGTFRLQAGLSADVTVDTRTRDRAEVAATAAEVPGR